MGGITMENTAKQGTSVFKVIGIVFCGLVGLCILGGIVGKGKGGDRGRTSGGSSGTSSGGSGSTSSGGTGAVVPDVAVPAEQAAFVSAIEAAKEDYKAAPNELKKSAVRTARGKKIEAALRGSRSATGWVGTLKKMETNSDGKAIVAIQLHGSEVAVKTWNNALSDVGDHTLIAHDSALFRAIAEMSEGDGVSFTATFASSDKVDFVKECSMTESGSMRDPEFICVFKDIKRR
jgi:hypothetical protein